MRPGRAEMVQHAADVMGIIEKIEWPLVVVTFPVSSRVPSDCVPVFAECGQVWVPVSFVAPDAVQKDEKIALADVID